ncbi:hypothetical protein M0811_07460 [Anaeramoeba ignava]|uniref:Uncharacterized protein n=1 Tax=Anaeramoeba ignava TaxID=1746090 RepID=A0A9Q0LMY7_ANAIG|nr:hypothetical protein M0811_07460 [Anaeramoeba ignava]
MEKINNLVFKLSKKKINSIDLFHQNLFLENNFKNFFQKPKSRNQKLSILKICNKVESNWQKWKNSINMETKLEELNEKFPLNKEQFISELLTKNNFPKIEEIKNSKIKNLEIFPN